MFFFPSLAHSLAHSLTLSLSVFHSSLVVSSFPFFFFLPSFFYSFSFILLSSAPSRLSFVFHYHYPFCILTSLLFLSPFTLHTSILTTLVFYISVPPFTSDRYSIFNHFHSFSYSHQFVTSNSFSSSVSPSTTTFPYCFFTLFQNRTHLSLSLSPINNGRQHQPTLSKCVIYPLLFTVHVKKEKEKEKRLSSNMQDFVSLESRHRFSSCSFLFGCYTHGGLS